MRLLALSQPEVSCGQGDDRFTTKSGHSTLISPMSALRQRRPFVSSTSNYQKQRKPGTVGRAELSCGRARTGGIGTVAAGYIRASRGELTRGHSPYPGCQDRPKTLAKSTLPESGPLFPFNFPICAKSGHSAGSKCAVRPKREEALFSLS